MGRPKKVEQTVEVPVTVTSEKDLDKIMKSVIEDNPDASLLSESALSEVNDWISTDCYALNAIISGSVYKGVPSGRVTVFYGLPMTGKTLLVNKIIANGQKKGYSRVAYFDSEIALDKAVAERLGCDVTHITHIPVETIEECKIQVLKLFTKLLELHAKRKLIVVIDSLGNLSSQKEFSDIDKDKSAGDMGLRAKVLASLMRMMTYRAAKLEAPVLCTNHIYENPNEMYPSMIKKQTGGLKPLFIASLLVQLSVTNNKVEDTTKDIKSLLSDRVSGVTLRALTAKNRFVPPFITADNIQLNFKTGLSKYMGLLELAEKYGTIEKDGHSYKMKNGTSIGYAATFEDKAEFWENGPLQELDLLIQKDLTYSNEKYKELKDQVDDIAEVEEEKNVTKV